MEPMSNHAARLPFTSTDVAYLQSRLAAGRTKRRLSCDIEFAGGSRDSEISEALRKGVVKLSSRNLGYDFALINVEAGKGIFGTRKTVVELYIKIRGDSRYALLAVVSNLPKALAMVDRIYDESAEHHLP